MDTTKTARSKFEQQQLKRVIKAKKVFCDTMDAIRKDDAVYNKKLETLLKRKEVRS